MKKLKAILLVIASVLCLSACSKGSGKDITVDTASLAKEINTNAVTSDTLTEAAANMLSSIYFIKDEMLSSGSAYMSSGSTACEVAVIECKDAGQTADVKKLFENRVSNQSSLYASYNAGEVDKLKKAIIKTAGKYVVFAVVDDVDKANEILKKAGF